MGEKAVRTHLGPLLRVTEITSALVAEGIQRAIAKQAVEILGLGCFMAGEILALRILEEGIALPLPILFVRHYASPPVGIGRQERS